jgi:hypothetical protein
VAGSIALFLACFNFHTPMWRRIAPACAAAILLPLFRSLAQATTANEWENSYAFMGLGASLGVGLACWVMAAVQVTPVTATGWTLRLPPLRAVRILFLVAAALWGAGILEHIATAGWARTIQEFTKYTVFKDRIHVRGLEHVRWGEPTEFNANTVLPKADLEGVVSYLATKPKHFFVMGDSTLLYGLLEAPSPQPLLYFQPSHAFLDREIPYLDEKIFSALERNGVDTVVREKVTYRPDMQDVYKRFPRTWAWFSSNFSHVTDFGNYEIWVRKAEG